MTNISQAKRGIFTLVSGSLSILEKQLRTNETPLIIVQGQFDDKPGVLAATSERVIFVGKLLFSSVVKEVPYSKLSSISLQSGIIQSTIKLEFSGGKLEIKSIAKEVAKEFVEVINKKLNEKDQKEEEPAAPASKNNSNEDIYDKLKKLGELKDAGILTDEEFAIQKKKLLD